MDRDTIHTPTEQPMTLSLRETAERHGMAASTLSTAIKDGREAKGMDLAPFVRYGDNGQISHFAFPSDYSFPDEEGGDVRSTNEQSSEQPDGEAADPPISKTAPSMEGHEWLSYPEAYKLILEEMPLDSRVYGHGVWPVFRRTAFLPSSESMGHVSSAVVEEFIRLCAEQGYRRALDQIRRQWSDDDDHHADGPADW